MLRRIWSNRNSHALLAGKQTGSITLEILFTVPIKDEHTPAPWRSIPSPRWIASRNVKIYLLKIFTKISIAVLSSIAKIQNYLYAHQ